MNENTFRSIALSEWEAMPERFKNRVKNVALLVCDEPSEETRREEGLREGETLLGLYHGIPNTLRGSEYGVGETLPDTITLYRLPILAEAEELTDTDTSHFIEQVKKVIRETIWHEVGHYFGLDEHPINEREDIGTNRFV
ncbi:metallopeptidase family protein [Candidatus Parcubacteria bacterium]|nr:metallopeptidase family protein [Candidatus Parcubacteria bacterium]